MLNDDAEVFYIQHSLKFNIRIRFSFKNKGERNFPLARWLQRQNGYPRAMTRINAASAPIPIQIHSWRVRPAACTWSMFCAS